MALRREDTSSGCSWIPTTPAKLGSKEHQLICVNSEENRSVQVKWMESERLIPVNQVTQINLTDSRRTLGDFLVESPYQNIPACCSSNSANVSEGSQVYGEALCNFDIWRSEKAGSSRVYGEGLRVNDKFSMNDPDQWVNMSFTDLLALADGGSNIMSFGNSLTPNAGNLPEGKFDGGNSMPETPFGGTSIPSRPSFDHNTLPRAALSNSTPSHFEPITPEKNWQMEQRQDSTAMQELSTYDGPTKEAQNNTVTREEVEGHNEKKKQSQLANGQLCENYKPDKEGTEEVDLTKTPQQKSRRKKHRPKVIKEGKTKSTPKPRPEKPLGTQESRVKRKYTRRVSVINSISSPSQGEAIETDTNRKAAMSKDTPVGKRQRTSRKAVDKAEATMDMGAIKTVDQMTGRSTRSSCRRSLNFDSVCQVRDECWMYIPSSNCNIESQAESFSRDDQSRTNVEHRQGKEVIMEKNDMGIAHRITGSIYQELDDYLSRYEKCSPSSAPAEADQPKKDYCPSDRIVSIKGKCQIVFSDVTNDKEVNNIQLIANISNDSISSSLLTPDRLAGGLKRHMDTIAKAEQYSNDSTKTLNNPIPRFSQRTSKNCGIPEMHFPVVYKRNGNEMGFNTTTNLQYSNVKVGRGTDSIAQLLPSATNQGSSDLQCEATDTLIGNTNGTKDGRQVFEDLLALGPREKIRKRKSKAPTQVQNSISIQEMRVSQGEYTKKSKNGKTIGQHAHMKALVADTSSPVTKGHLKRILPNSILGNGYNHHELPARSTGSPLAITWKQTSQIDSIVDQLNQLNLHAETSQVSTQNRHAFVAHHMHFQLQGAIVPYQTGGAVVAFDRSFDQVRRRQPRPKVDLDDETTRVWKLLLENINSEGIDGTDEKNAKWWEEERRVFNGRADSFIARMHLVQGDRRFSPWKGSVVDSVVGVFLTQNVSDHLSSSAFMALAARFPLKAKTIPAELHEARVGTKMDEPEICMLEPEETVGSNKNGVDNVKLLHYTENGDIRVVNSVKSLGNSFADSIAKEGLRDISECSSVISHASVSNKSPSLNGDGQDMDEAVSSQTTVISSQNSADSLIAQTARTESSQQSHTGEDPATGAQPNRFTSSTSFVKLLQMAGTVRHGVYGYCSDKEEFDRNQNVQSESSPMSSQTEYSLTGSTFAVEANVCSMSASRLTPNSGTGEVQVELFKRCSECSDSYRGKGLPTAEISELSVEYVSHTTMKFTSVTSEECPNFSRPNDKIGINPEIAGKQMSEVPSLGHFEGNCCKIDIPDIAYPQNLMDVTGSNNNSDISRKSEHIEVNSKKGPVYHPGEMVNGPKTKGEKKGKDKQDPVDWDVLRKQALKSGSKGERTANTMDSVDWEAVRRADVSEVADAIKERGMNNKLAERIKDFLDRIVRDHESIDLEWLRDVPPDKAKEYLLSVRGLGLKSVECVRLLTLHQLAFPVDTNVGRIAVRLGWVPLRPLPESLQLHLLELYPVLESIQKYLWPRLCKLDQKTLYELHYQLITFGKVFCTKSRPNCNACPMRGECRHFASAFASARLALPMPENKSIVSAAENISAGPYPMRAVNTLGLPALLANHMDVTPGVNNYVPIIEEPKTPEPIIELPATPEIEDTQIPECDIEDTFYEDPDEIPSIQLNMEEFTQNLQKVMQQNTELQEGSMSNALVALTREAASIPVPKLKNVSRLRTEHQVYELPDSHPLLQGMEQREPDDPSPYLLAIWTPGETINSIEPPERRCSLQESEKLCTDETCSSCNSKREINSQTVRGTLLIPCRTAMRGSFPLNGTYFQVNEVFSDHESSLTPIDVPREWLWNLRRRTVYFGTSVPTIFKGLITEQIQYCFWRGFVCVRGFDRKARAPRPLIARLHFPASKLAKAKGKTGEN